MNWLWEIVLGWGVPLGIWLVVRAYGRRRPSATVRRETSALQSGPQIPRLGIGPGVLSKPGHSQGTASKGDRPGRNWHLAFKLFIGRRIGAFVSREAPLLQLNQEVPVPRRGRRQLSQGVAREWFYDRSRNREMDLREQAERDKMEHGLLLKSERNNKERPRR
jgi:hypothetical protein